LHRPEVDAVVKDIPFTGMTRQAKLVELRRKTDRDLLILAHRELERGLALADVATTKQSPLYGLAETAYRTLKTLMPGIDGLTESERSELELNLKQLRAALDRIPDRHVQHCIMGTCGADDATGA
jgi:hypothetical protein